MMQQGKRRLRWKVVWAEFWLLAALASSLAFTGRRADGLECGIAPLNPHQKIVSTTTKMTATTTRLPPTTTARLPPTTARLPPTTTARLPPTTARLPPTTTARLGPPTTPLPPTTTTGPNPTGQSRKPSTTTRNRPTNTRPPPTSTSPTPTKTLPEEPPTTTSTTMRATTTTTSQPFPETTSSPTKATSTKPRDRFDINLNVNMNINVDVNVNVNVSGLERLFKGKRSEETLSPPSTKRESGLEEGAEHLEGAPFVLGGHTAIEGAWPWIVSLKQRGYHQCGGTIINEKFILTAAHCFDKKGGRDPLNWRVTIGEHHIRNADKWEENRLIDKIIVHEEWNQPKALQNDLAMVRLKTPLDLTGGGGNGGTGGGGSGGGGSGGEHVGIACLPRKNWNVRTRKDCWLAGWGYYKIEEYKGQWIYYPATVLQEVKGFVWSEEGCKEKWKSTFQPGMLCFGHDQDHFRVYGSCLGDSGGPMVCLDERNRYVVSGVVSFGRSDCLLLPNVFTDVAQYTDWIYTNMLLNDLN